MAEKSKTVFRKLHIGLWSIVFFFCVFFAQKVQAADEAVLNARNGIVGIQSGFTDAKGKFCKMRFGSGFLIRNDENAVYIVTNNRIVSNSAGAMKKYCKKHSIKTENLQLSNQIRVIVKGDVTVEASVLVSSEEKDYCILTIENVVSEKNALKLDSSADISAEAAVYALGFPDKTDEIDFLQSDVEVRLGTVLEKEAGLSSGIYIQHSAPVTAGNTGGPLLDEDGYVIGLNCQAQKDAYYALPVSEIMDVLNNFSIYYGSRGIDETYIKLKSFYEECLNISSEDDARDYEEDTFKVFQQTLLSTGELLKQENPEKADLDAAYQSLAAAKDKLSLKTGSIAKAVIVLAVCDVLLFIWLFILTMLNRKEERNMNIPYQQGDISFGHAAQKSKNPLQQESGDQPFPLGNILQYKGQSYHEQVLEKNLVLVREKNGQVSVVDKKQFIIGTNRSLVDLCIMDNRAVSRRHAAVFEDYGIWYINDMGSSNGTFVNSVRIVPGRAVRIKAGDEILLADEAFTVQE